MLHTEKKAISEVLEKQNKEFGVECIRELHRSCSIPMKEMYNIHLCFECSWEKPQQLDMEMPFTRDNQLIAEEVAQAQAEVEDSNAGL
jgi:hypothetical protein